MKDLASSSQGERVITRVYEPYRIKDLTQILLSRVGTKLFQQSAIEFIARKISATSGDCRRALELAAQSCGHALTKIREAGKATEEYNNNNNNNNSSSSSTTEKGAQGGTLVTMQHAIQAVRSSMPTKFGAIISSLGVPAQCILSIAVCLSLEGNLFSGGKFTQGQLHSQCRSLMHKYGICDSLTSDMFDSLMGTLTDNGLMELDDHDGNGSMMGAGNSSGKKITFFCQLEDVEEALDGELKDQVYYRDIVKLTTNQQNQQQKGRK
jgi:Cdc6-like AAA superfamily ATPase